MVEHRALCKGANIKKNKKIKKLFNYHNMVKTCES